MKELKTAAIKAMDVLGKNVIKRPVATEQNLHPGIFDPPDPGTRKIADFHNKND